MTRQTTRETTVQNQINSDHFEQLMASLMNKTDAIQNSIDRINKLDQASVFIPSIRPVTGSPEKKPSIFTAPSMIKPTVSQSFNQYNQDKSPTIFALKYDNSVTSYVIVQNDGLKVL